MTSVLQQGGVSNAVTMESWEAGGTASNGTNIKIKVLPIDGGSQKAPYSAPEGKEWKQVNFEAQEP